MKRILLLLSLFITTAGLAQTTPAQDTTLITPSTAFTPQYRYSYIGGDLVMQVYAGGRYYYLPTNKMIRKYFGQLFTDNFWSGNNNSSGFWAGVGFISTAYAPFASGDHIGGQFKVGNINSSAFGGLTIYANNVAQWQTGRVSGGHYSLDRWTGTAWSNIFDVNNTTGMIQFATSAQFGPTVSLDGGANVNGTFTMGNGNSIGFINTTNPTARYSVKKLDGSAGLQIMNSITSKFITVSNDTIFRTSGERLPFLSDIATTVGDTSRLANKNSTVGTLRDSTEFVTYTGAFTAVTLRDSLVGDGSTFYLLPKGTFTKNGGTRYASNDATKLWFRQHLGRSVNVHWWGVKADWGKPQGNITVTGTDQAGKLQQIINSYYQGNVELYFPASRLAYGISVPVKLKQGTVLKGERPGFFPYQSTNGVDTVKFYPVSRILAYNRKDAIVIDQTVVYRPQNNGLTDLSIEGTSVGTQDTTAGFKLYTSAGGNPGLNFAHHVSFNGFGTGIDFKLANDFHGLDMSVRNSRVGWRNGGNNIVIDGNGEVAFVDTIGIIKGVSFRAQGLQFALYKEGLHLSGATNAMILDNYFYNGKLSTTDNIVFDNVTGNNNILISRNNMASPKRYGIRINSGGNTTISGNTVTGAAFEAIYVRQSADLTVTNNSITTPTTSSVFAMRFDTVTNYRNINNFTQSYDFAHRFSQTGGNQIDVYNYGSNRTYGTYAQPGQMRIINYGNSHQSPSYIASGQLLGGGFTLGGTSNSTTEKVTAAFNARATQTYTSTAFGTQLELQGIPNNGSTLTTFFTASETGGKSTQFISTATATGTAGTDSVLVKGATDNVVKKISPTYYATLALLAPAAVISSAATLTLSHGIDYVFSGTTSTWTLPAVSGTTTGRAYLITIKNRGSGNLTVNSNTGSTIYDGSAVTTITIAPGSATTLMPDGTYFNKE